MVKGHGGNIYELSQTLGCKPSDIIDMSSNVNPLGPPEGVFDCLRDNLDKVMMLPEVDAAHMIDAFAAHYNLDAPHVIAGNGTTQFIYAIPLILKAKHALILAPVYADYADACRIHGVSIDYLVAEAEQLFQFDPHRLEQAVQAADTVFICNPCNPTGVLLPGDYLYDLCRSFPRTRFVIDESYLPFVTNAKEHSLLTCRLENVLVLNSMSKIFRIPGLRIGFLIAEPAIIDAFKTYHQPWSVNSLAQLTVTYVMRHPALVDRFISTTLEFLETQRKMFYDTFESVPALTLFPSQTSFVLGKLEREFTAEKICQTLARGRVLIRNCSNFYGLNEQFIRISLKDDATNRVAAEMLLDALS